MKLKDGYFSGLSHVFARGKKGLASILNTKVDREDFASIAPLAANADAATIAAKVNAILAKLK